MSDHLADKSLDITPILAGWEYQPDQISVRRIMGIDGKPKIQFRLDLGLFQMEWDGRPDGIQPYGEESMLAHYLAQCAAYRAEHGTEQGFELNHDDCERLQAEAMQYYHRRISFFELSEYERAFQDAEHNLRIMDLIKMHATDENDKLSIEQFRPFVIMHRTRAQCLLNLARKDPVEALRNIQEGIKEIERFFEEYGRRDLIEVSAEIAFLRNWEQEVRQETKRVKLSPLQRLQQSLEEAIAQENFEEAARLRDEIQRRKNRNARHKSLL